jgi:hypothetical protein
MTTNLKGTYMMVDIVLTVSLDMSLITEIVVRRWWMNENGEYVELY